MREEIGGVFRRTIELGNACLTGEQIKEVVAQLMGTSFHTLPHFDETDCFTMGRRRGYGFGSDVILVTGLDLPSNPLLWLPGRRYVRVTVCDARWNDGYHEDFLASIDKSLIKENDITIASLHVITDALSDRLNQRVLELSS